MGEKPDEYELSWLNVSKEFMLVKMTTLLTLSMSQRNG